MLEVEAAARSIAKVQPRVIDYMDYHVFLRDYFLYKKSQNPRFSYRRFAALSGSKTSNFLLLVMKNQRRLSLSMAESVAKAMKLAKPEIDYFVALVKLEQCRNPQEYAEFDRDRKIAIRKIVTKLIPIEKAHYLSVWYYPLIRELVFLPDFTPRASWIADKLSGLVTEAQAEKAIEIMFSLDLWKINGDGKVLPTEVFVDTGVENKNFGEIKLESIHQENLKAWAKILPSIPRVERELGIINIPINENKIPEFKKRIRQFQDEIIGWLQDEKDPTRIVQLGTYLIPVTKKSET